MKKNIIIAFMFVCLGYTNMIFSSVGDRFLSILGLNSRRTPLAVSVDSECISITIDPVDVVELVGLSQLACQKIQEYPAQHRRFNQLISQISDNKKKEYFVTAVNDKMMPHIDQESILQNIIERSYEINGYKSCRCTTTLDDKCFASSSRNYVVVNTSIFV